MLDDITIRNRLGYDAATVEAADRDRMQGAASDLLAAIDYIMAPGVALRAAVDDFSAGIQPLLEAVFDCGDWHLPSLWAVEEALLRYVAGKADDLPDFTELVAVLVTLRDNADGYETEDEREQRRRDGILTSEEFEWAVECAETERGLNAQFARDAALDCNWRD